MVQGNASSRRKEQGRAEKARAKGNSSQSSNIKKDSGLPAFFKHRKAAFINDAAISTVAKASAAQKGKGKGKDPQNGEEEPHADLDMDDLTGAATETRTLAQGVAEESAAAKQDDSFTFQASVSPANNPFSHLSADPALTGGRDSSLRAYISQLRKLMTESDILLEVLDARDPLSCRSYATETLALGQGKKIVLILNKIDLVPRDNVEKWLKYLRHDFPTLAFKSSTQQQRTNLSQGAGSVPIAKGSTALLQSGSEALGATALLQLLKNYSRHSSSLKTSLNVGVFGAPNVGKSSLINSLKRARVCAVAATPGHTKVLQSVALDKKIRLIDCPGIVFKEKEKGQPQNGAKGSESDGLAAALRNVVKVELLQDPISPISVVLSRVSLADLEKLYSLPPASAADLSTEKEDQSIDPSLPIPEPDMTIVTHFLLRLALRKGRLMAGGGAPDLEGVARTVLHDWNTGKIRYATEPPKIHRSALLSTTNSAVPTSGKPSAGQAGESGLPVPTVSAEAEAIAATSSLKTSFDAEFDLAGLLGEADTEALLGAGGTAQAEAMDTSELPQSISNAVPQTGRGSLAHSADGKALLQARERRFAADEAESIAIDDEPVATAPQAEDVANQTTSTLGKRRRFGNDDSSDEDEESQDEEDSDSEMEGRRAAVPPRKQVRAARQDLSAVGADNAEDLPSWLDRQRNKAVTGKQKRRDANAKDAKLSQRGTLALLSSVFSPVELENMAVSRGTARKRAKKLKRRAEKSGAGGLADFVEQTVLEDEEANDLSEDGKDDDADVIEEDDEPLDSRHNKRQPFAMLEVDSGQDASEEEL